MCFSCPHPATPYNPHVGWGAEEGLWRVWSSFREGLRGIMGKGRKKPPEDVGGVPGGMCPRLPVFRSLGCDLEHGLYLQLPHPFSSPAEAAGSLISRASYRSSFYLLVVCV